VRARRLLTFLSLAFVCLAAEPCLAQSSGQPGLETDNSEAAAARATAQQAPRVDSPALRPAPRVRRLRAPNPTPAQAVGLGGVQTADTVRIALVLTLLTLIPALIVCMTPFVRIVVVLSMIRHGLGMPETPPNQVLVILSIFLTAFIMMPTLTQVNQAAVQPFLGGSMSVQNALQTGAGPMREFMLRQVHDSDIATIYQVSKQPLPTKAQDVGTMQLISAFMLNELRVSFKIGFVIMLPFLLIDLVVSSILLALGMIMVPPTTLSLPVKILMFVLIDGWSLVLQGVVGSFR
jgi:flagellar biosynthesis protein FliP